MNHDGVQRMNDGLLETDGMQGELPMMAPLGQEWCTVTATRTADIQGWNPPGMEGTVESGVSDVDTLDWDDEYVTDLYSDLAAQYDWEERLAAGWAIARCCTTCVYFCWAFNPAIPCAVHPAGSGTDVTAPNECPDWALPDVSWVLTALAQTLSDHPLTTGQAWMILRLAYRDEDTVIALVQVNQERHQWAVCRWDNREGAPPVMAVWYECPCWKNLGEQEQSVVWVHPDSHPNGSATVPTGSEFAQCGAILLA